MYWTLTFSMMYITFSNSCKLTEISSFLFYSGKKKQGILWNILILFNITLLKGSQAQTEWIRNKYYLWEHTVKILSLVSSHVNFIENRRQYLEWSIVFLSLFLNEFGQEVEKELYIMRWNNSNCTVAVLFLLFSPCHRVRGPTWLREEGLGEHLRQNAGGLKLRAKTHLQSQSLCRLKGQMRISFIHKRNLFPH